MAHFSLRSWFQGAACVATVSLAPCLVASCRGATQITLHVRTNLPCTDGADWQGVAVFVGKPGADVEESSATLVTRACEADGTIGSLVVVPSDAKDSEVGLRVVAGLTRNPEECELFDYQGCIVARRTLRYSPHDSLELDVELTADCVNIGCDPLRTCLTGGCIESRAVDDPPDVEVSGPSVRCGDNGARCATSGNVCCLALNAEAGTTFGECLPARDCPATSTVLNCDDDTDCDAARDANGKPKVCVLSYTHELDLHFTPNRVALSECMFANHEAAGDSLTLGLCQERKACVDSTFSCEASYGAPNQLPGYFWCRLAL